MAQVDGDEDLGDKVGNAGDEIRKDLGNAGDESVARRRWSRSAADDFAISPTSPAPSTGRAPSIPSRPRGASDATQGLERQARTTVTTTSRSPMRTVGSGAEGRPRSEPRARSTRPAGNTGRRSRSAGNADDAWRRVVSMDCNADHATCHARLGRQHVSSFAATFHAAPSAGRRPEPGPPGPGSPLRVTP